jgi:signal peptidase I
MNDKTLTIILLVASALILLLEISIFISVIPPAVKIKDIEDYKKQVNSTLSNREFIAELISQDLVQKQRIDTLETELANQKILASYLASRLNTSLNVEVDPFRQISKDDIKVYNDKVIIYVNKAFTAGFTESESMYPLISENVLALEVMPDNQAGLKVGDIIGYESKAFNTSIIHRIIEIGEDEQGWYAIAKGDNNPAPDPVKVRFEDIQGLLRDYILRY